MEKHSLSTADISLDTPLPWDVYDAHNNLLLRKGYSISNQRQLEALLERGLFVDEDAYRESRPDGNGDEDHGHEDASALRVINQAHARFAQCVSELQGNGDSSGFEAGILGIADLLRQAIEISPDITLACMLFKQKAEDYAVRHCIDAAIISRMLADGLGKSTDDITTITCAALTMNISILALQEELQHREAGPTPEENDFIRHHPEMSVNILRKSGITDKAWLSCVLHHHENVDGTGYPFGKSGDQFPENAKLVSLADRYTALLSPRTYRKAILPSEALGKILVERGKGVDSLLAANFIRTLGIYPPGAFVKLRSGEVAVVSHRGKGGGAMTVHALIGAFGAPLPYPHKRETDNERYEIREAVQIHPHEIPFTMQQIWGPLASP